MRQTDRQTYRETNRQTYKQTQSTDRQTVRTTNSKKTDRLIQRQCHAHKFTYTSKYKQVHKQYMDKKIKFQSDT